MWQYLGDHYNLLLGLFAGLVWLVAFVWFLQSTGILQDWRDSWRKWRDRSTW